MRVVLAAKTLAIALSALCIAPTISAEESLTAEELFARARFDQALAAFEGILADEDATATQVARAHLYVAALRLMDGEEERASEHIAASAAIDSTLELPPGSPPQLGSLRAGVVAAQPEGGLRLTFVTPDCPAAGTTFTAEATASGAPRGLVASVFISCEGGRRVVMSPREEGTATELTFPLDTLEEDDQVVCEARALASSGAVLRSESSTVTVCPAPSEPAAPRPAVPSMESDEGGESIPGEDGDGDRRRRSPWVWVGVAGGVAVAVAAVVLAVVLTRTPDQYDLGPIRIEDQ